MIEFKNTQGVNKNILQLKPNEPVKVIFRGHIADFYQHWLGEGGSARSIKCTGIANNCPGCVQGKKPGFRFRINVIVKDSEGYQVKVFENGWKAYQQMEALQKAGYDLEHTVMQITKTGEKLQSVYTITPLPNGIISPETEGALLKLTLIEDLLNMENETSQDMANAATRNMDDIPF